MRKLLVAMGSMGMVAGALAQEAFQCVNPDVLNALVYEGRAQFPLVVKQELPDDASGYGAPPEFTLIGSGVRGGSRSAMVAYKTDMEADKAFDSLLQFLTAQGWEEEANPAVQQPLVSVAGPRTPAKELCRDGARRRLQIREVDGARYAIIAGYTPTPQRACSFDPAQFSVPDTMATISTMRAGLPKISFPESARMATGTGVEESNQGSDAVASAVRIESPDSAASLAALVAAQLAAQGWAKDAEWNGKLSTGSTWNRSADDGKPYQGMLEILSLGQQTYNVEFTLSDASR